LGSEGVYTWQVGERALLSSFHSNTERALAKPPNFKQEKKRREEAQKKKNESKQQQKAARKGVVVDPMKH
jgi:hypothetical protein